MKNWACFQIEVSLAVGQPVHVQHDSRKKSISAPTFCPTSTLYIDFNYKEIYTTSKGKSEGSYPSDLAFLASIKVLLLLSLCLFRLFRSLISSNGLTVEGRAVQPVLCLRSCDISSPGTRSTSAGK